MPSFNPNPTIDQWSFSRILGYETCPHQTRLKYKDGKTELPRPPPPAGKEIASDRGSRIHLHAEQFVDGTYDSLIDELLCFEAELQHLRQLRHESPEQVLLEQLWTFDDTWSPCPADHPDLWLRVIPDVFVWVDPEMTEAVVVDYKTGKRIGNEVKHAQQVQLYQLAAFMKFPQLEFVSSEIWYLDHDELARTTFTRKQGMRFLHGWNTRAMKFTTDTKFEPRPSTWNCRFCPYQTGFNKWLVGTGDCDLNPEKPDLAIWRRKRDELLNSS